MSKTEKRGLGRGLGALFGDDITVHVRKDAKHGASEAPAAGGGALADMTEGAASRGTALPGGDVSRETTTVRISLIEPNRDQPRKNFDEESLKELAASIKEHGILQPILVQKTGGTYTILVGERRWRAARIAGLKDMPVIIKDVGKQEAAEIALIENIQREDLGAVEEAKAYRALIEEYKMTQEELADRVGRSRTSITNSMRLLQLDEDVLALIESGEITAGHARAILGINGKRAQYKAAREVVNNRLSVRETEKLAKRYNAPKKVKQPKENDLYLDSQAEALTRVLNTKVSIKPGRGSRGRIEIEYYSAEELEGLIGRLGGGTDD